MPFFVNYKKPNVETIQYENIFLDDENFIAFSKPGRSLESQDADHVYKRGISDKDNKLYLFVRKNKNEGAKEFYFLGEIEAVGEPREEIIDKKKVFRIHFHLKTPVREDILDYMLSDIDSEAVPDSFNDQNISR